MGENGDGTPSPRAADHTSTAPVHYESTSHPLEILLIEDNPGDERLIREMLRDTDELTKRMAPAQAEQPPPTIVHEDRLAAGIDHLTTSTIDIVLLDLNLPDSRGLDTLDRVLAAAEDIPIIVLTGMPDQDLGFCAIEHGAQEYLVKGEVTTGLLIRSIHHAIVRQHQERERERRREQLEAINQLNEISQDITHLVITTSTRDELEQRVCDRLVESDGYALAWIGTLDPGTQQIDPNVFAGPSEAVFEAATDSINSDGEQASPFTNAIESGCVTTASISEPPSGTNPLSDRGYRSIAVVPIAHNEVIYDALAIYATTPNAFIEPELVVLEGVGRTIGHAIAALKRKDALVGDLALELEFQIEDFAEQLVALTVDGGSITFTHLTQNNDTLVAYGSTSGVTREQFLEAAETIDWVGQVCILTEGQDTYDFELQVPDRIALFETIASHGGRVASATITDGEFRFVIQVSHGIDTRRLIEAIESESTGVSYVAQRSASGNSHLNSHSVLENELTDKQREALETAVFAGYFDWPRQHTGEEIADKLGISAATFTQHLRTAERKFFERLFDR